MLFAICDARGTLVVLHFASRAVAAAYCATRVRCCNPRDTHMREYERHRPMRQRTCVAGGLVRACSALFVFMLMSGLLGGDNDSCRWRYSLSAIMRRHACDCDGVEVK